MSIIVQGGLLKGHQAEIASNCEHWRTLFPDAEIILAISTSDLLHAPCPGPLAHLIPARHLVDDGQVIGALSILERCCDVIVMAEPALPLPPIKFDTTGLNHGNLQIAAARAGLAAATRPKALRTRNDLTFADASFVRQHQAGTVLPRGHAASLAERVLISSIYTLNPFALERMPFHLSDWFHYGRTDDLRELWNVEAITLANATFFDRHRHPDKALAHERLHRTRLTVEQHLAFASARRHLPNARLAQASDLSSRALSLDYLCDNFVVCDLQAAGCRLPKYAAELLDPVRTAHCFTARDWHYLALAAPPDRPALAAAQATRAIHPEQAPFPRLYPAPSLVNTADHAAANPTIEICAVKATGVVSHGPYDALPAGRYTAAIHASVLNGPGRLTLRATAFGGRTILAEITADIGSHEIQAPMLAFDIDCPVATGVEIVVEAAGLEALCITAIEIAERLSGLPSKPPAQRRHGVSQHLGRAWRWAQRRLPRLSRWCAPD